MTLELVAGRLIARYLGSSLYTWTSVIGVVLAGITIGNYLGGRIADRYTPAKTLSVLFTLSSIACVLVVISNNLVNQWILLWELNWPVRVFTHVSLVFFIPSMLLGTISPVVAKMALDKKLATGRTVGDIYAAGAAGSIFGTFLAGFYLIAMMGTIAIVWTIAAALLLMAALYRPGFWVYVWAVIFIALVTMGMAPVEWVGSAGASVGLREKHDPDMLYEDESQYGYIAVKQLSKNPDLRQFNQDNSKNQSTVVMDNIKDLKFVYPRIYAALTHSLSKDKTKLSTLMIGGGGHVYPRYVMELWPGSRVDVVEIDPAVTKAAILAFGFPADSAINVLNMDARNYLSDLIRKQTEQESVQQYDFVYGDAFADYAIPYHLTTKEFNDDIATVLKDDGVYILNVIDVCRDSRFLRSVVGTFQKTFPYVYILAEVVSCYEGGNFVVVGAKRKLDLEGINQHETIKNLTLWISTDAEIKQLEEKTGAVVLTDDYAPVENLLSPFAQWKASLLLGEQYIEQAKALSAEHRWDESIAMYRDAAKVIPKTNLRVYAYTETGNVLAKLGRWEEAIEAARAAIECNDKAAAKQSMSVLLHNIYLALNKLGRREEAAEYLYKAIQAYKEDLAREPYSAQIAVKLGSTLVEARKFDEAIEQLQNAIAYMSEHNQTQDEAKLQQYLEFVETEKKKHQ
jgi:spermidine synthase/thioredoxin-like negative regulator of GroEL